MLLRPSRPVPLFAALSAALSAALLFALFAAAFPALAQHTPTPLPQHTSAPLSADPARNPATTLGQALRSLASRSGVVFLGRVDQIDRGPGVIIITLAVLDPMLGNPGPTYTLREWAGLWPPGRQRYAIGQRALFFLHPPSATGFSSPVDGQFGVVPLLPTSADSDPLLDTRWLATRLQRPTGSPLPEPAAISLQDASTLITRWNAPTPIAEPAPHQLPPALRLATPGAR